MPAIFSRNGPIFIVGAPRSGTTLLQYMMRSHPRISLPTGESHFIIPLYRNAENYGDLSRLENIRAVLDAMYRQSESFLDTDLHGMKFNAAELAKEFQREGRDTMPAIISGLFEKNARGEGKVRWGDKTPYYVLHIPLILEMFPDAQIIHLLRDGRDVALSLLERRKDFGVYNIYSAAKYWQLYVDIGQRMGRGLPRDKYIEIKYEDILGNPETEMRKICAFLEEDYFDSLVNFKTAGQAGKTPLLQKRVQATNMDKWRMEMTAMQKRIFESAAGTSLVNNGYQLDTCSTSFPLPVRAWFRLHNVLLKIFNKYQRTNR